MELLSKVFFSFSKLTVKFNQVTVGCILSWHCATSVLLEKQLKTSSELNLPDEIPLKE